MHPAQKQAILAMLQSIQTQIVQVQGLLGYDAAAPAPQPPRDVPRSSQTEYLSDEEEENIDKALEDARLAGLSEAEMIRKSWERQQSEMSGVSEAAF